MTHGDITVLSILLIYSLYFVYQLFLTAVIKSTKPKNLYILQNAYILCLY